MIPVARAKHQSPVTHLIRQTQFDLITEPFLDHENAIGAHVFAVGIVLRVDGQTGRNAEIGIAIPSGEGDRTAKPWTGETDMGCCERRVI